MKLSEADKLMSGLGMPVLRGELRRNEPMSKHTSWRVGGEAERFYVPADLADFADLLRDLPQSEPVYLVGLGSNLLVRDGGLRGTVVTVHARLADLQLVQQDKSSGLIYAGAGVACAKVARFAALYNLSGAEFLAGIPGTVGGAMAMNAGCYDNEIWNITCMSQVIDRAGKIFIRQPDEYEIGYRHVALRTVFPAVSNAEWFVGGYFRLEQGNQAISREKIKKLLAMRVSSQPLNLPNAGSVFRNPPGDYAARLIECCGLKGVRMGGAMISSKHANFIVNTGHATATDIELLITMIQDTVEKKTGIKLIQEVCVIGDSRSGIQ